MNGSGEEKGRKMVRFLLLLLLLLLNGLDNVQFFFVGSLEGGGDHTT